MVRVKKNIECSVIGLSVPMWLMSIHTSDEKQQKKSGGEIGV